MVDNLHSETDIMAISKAELREMFAIMAAESGWDLTKPLLWGYFFTHDEPEPLRQAAMELQRQGYSVVDVNMADKEAPREPDVWVLHVERVECHTVDSLHKRNQVLGLFATAHGLDSYDGMDVGLPHSE